ncbi:hypothetical protein pEaSNUABM11_00057 [Erwinia phage pEa_SNUABM_11]|nr:hypothetical protein pEaSNUABM11_00057 [Erwinia phage pEa_SNUABM_11]
MYGFFKTALAVVQRVNPELSNRMAGTTSTTFERNQGCEEEEAEPSQEAQIASAFLIGRLSREQNK